MKNFNLLKSIKRSYKRAKNGVKTGIKNLCDEVKSKPVTYTLATMVSTLCVIALVFMFKGWLSEMTEKGAEIKQESLRSAIWVTVLFAAVGVIFVFKWFREFRGAFKKNREPVITAPRKARVISSDPYSETYDVAKVFVAMTAVYLAVLVFMWLLGCALGWVRSFSESLSLWTMLDSQHYITIAEHWYEGTGELANVVRIVFFPGFPLLIKAFYYIVGDYTVAAFVVAWLFFAGSGCMMYKLVRLDYDRDTAMRAVKYLCLVPGGFFFVAPMSESLFIFTTLAAIYFARKGKILPASLFGFYAALTRSLGVVAIVPIVYELIRKTLEDRPKGTTPVLKRIGEFACTLITPCGLLLYILMNKVITGDPFKFLYYQKTHWSQEISYFFNTAYYQTSQFFTRMESSAQVAIALWFMGLCALFGSLLMLLLSSKKMRASYIGYSMVYYVIAMGATWLLSGPRYMAAMFTLPLSFALITEKKRNDEIVTILLTAIYVAYSIMFINRWQVW